MNPIVITSKAAENHLNTIKSQHADIIQGMNDQATRVAQLKAERMQNQQVTDQANQAAKTESDKAALDGQARILEQQNKAQELAIKQQALSI